MPDTTGHNISERPLPISELIASVDRLAEIAESNEPPTVKLGRLCTQLAAVVHWAEQVRIRATDSPRSPGRGPHWRSARERQSGEGSSAVE